MKACGIINHMTCSPDYLGRYNVIVVFVSFRSTVVHVSTFGANHWRNPRGWRRDGVRPGSLGPPVLRQLRTKSDTADDGIRGRRRTGCRRVRRSDRVHFRRNWHRGCLGTAGHAHQRPSDNASCPVCLFVALTRSDRRSIKIFFNNIILCNFFYFIPVTRVLVRHVIYIKLYLCMYNV